MPENTSDSVSDVRQRMAEIASAIESGNYRGGPWARLTREIRHLDIEERRLLSDDVSGVSRKLHLRGNRFTTSAALGYAIEVVFAIAGAIVLIAGAHTGSNSLVILAALIWTMAFQPLIKVGVGHFLGVGYEYAYLYGIEPRFKMRFGEYLARPRYARFLLHLSGMIGSPLGACLPTLFVNPSLWPAIDVCWFIFWVVIAINAGSFALMLFGIRDRVGPIRLAEGSGGSAAIELREALEIGA
jgi:hypothetical protein